MDNNSNSYQGSKILKLKKYLFLISIIFLLFSFGNLLYRYLYNDSKLIAIKGGTISEGIIGNFPHLNPLKPSSGNDKYIISLLYRSLLKYDLEENKITSDIASCDISNLLYIECYLENNIKWSSGEEITTKDIVSTFKVLQNSDVNPIMKSILAETIIEESESKITFTNQRKDINFLNIFFQPIIPENIANSLGGENLKGNFSPIDGVYSGRYIINSVNQDSSLGITRITLEKNISYYKNDLFIGKFILKIFNDNAHFLKFKESINLFNDKDNLIGSSIPRLKAYKYVLPQYVGVFLNHDRLKNKGLRNFVLNKIDRKNLIKILGKSNFKEIKNPYITDIDIGNKEDDNKNIEKILNKMGYYKKSELSPIKKKVNKIISDEVETPLPNPPSSVVTVSLPPKIEGTEQNNENTKGSIELNNTSKTIVSPEWVEKYNFISKDSILLKGKVESLVDSVYINDYKLTGFRPGGKEFFYRLKKSYDTLKNGENTYKIYFEKDGKKELKEELTFVYNEDKQELENQKDEFFKKMVEELEKKSTIEQELIVDVDSEYNKKLESLDDNFFYNKDLEKLSFNLVYINSEKNINDTANYIKNSLNKAGIEINLIPISINELFNVLDKEEYDMILTGINLGYFDFNIFPYFHSSQVKNGYNFSNFKKLSLDILLEELKGNVLSKIKRTELEKKVLDILREEQIVKVLYTPIIRQLVDRNIKKYNIPEFMPEKSLRRNSLWGSYISEKKIINFENKGFLGFFKFLFKKIVE